MADLVFDPSIIALASFIIFLGALTQSLIGFGLAVVASPLLYLVEPELVPVPIIVMGFSISLLTLFRERGGLEFNGLQYALLGRLPGGILGAALLVLAPQAILGLAIASIVALAVILSIFKFTAPITRTSLFTAGFLSGVFGTIAAIGGPPLAILLAGKDAKQFRAALSAFFIFSSTIALIILSFAGLVTIHHFFLSALLLPSVILGYLVANRLVGRVDKQKIKILTLFLCSLSAILLASKSIVALAN
ncbi:sulfite exporter TauE/SafE family protein [Shewanella sp. Isolate11]|uniref:sulfite exporter TauE/SafE family protein n=1 Tax=Shewanella sp. Isolate11 TaxID=2908530 RepID=UPI001EFD28CE|nr:sulfite exporter TauE/SafE family protein [Shewanella sp. Isolate11]MCG9695578.1 sulfite exporter TauE/SafE family protein [Shewanella sp. Isolate11]